MSIAFLVEHPVGRMILQVVLAGLLLLLAVAPRAIAPQQVGRVERRDPLEQVDALAHAYEQVNATRTIASRLLRGVRWRVERGVSARALPDETFLSEAVARAPALAADVQLVRRALKEQVKDSELTDVGAALGRIEHTFTRTPS